MIRYLPHIADFGARLDDSNVRIEITALAAA